MNVEELFEFLIKEYGLSYQFQAFTNCYNGGWIVRTYSFLMIPAVSRSIICYREMSLTSTLHHILPGI